jgi:hypothetical protein
MQVSDVLREQVTPKQRVFSEGLAAEQAMTLQSD